MSRNLQLQVVLSALDKATGPIKAIMNSSSGLGKQLKQTRDQLKGLQAQQSNIQSFKALKQASEQSKQAMAAQQQKVKELSMRMRETTAPTKAMTKEFQAAAREAHRLKQNHGANTQQLQAMRGKLNEAGISTRNLGDAERSLRSRITDTNKSLTDQQNRLKRVTDQQKRLSQAKAQYQRTTQLASSMTTAGAGAMAAGGGVLYGGARLMQTGMEFDTSMSKVQSLARLDINSPEMKALREQARKLGADTMFSATEAAQGQGFLAMAGFTPQAILDAMPGMLDIAKSGDIDLALTADIASNILTGMNLEAADMARVGDILVGTFTRSNTSLAMLGDTMKYVAPVAASVGQDIETVAAMAGKLGDAGIQGSMGGTALRSIINRLSSPPKAAADALDALGISAKDAQGNMRGMPDVLTELYEKTKLMGTADRSAALKAIAGSEAVSAMQVLVKQAGSGELQEFVATLRNAQGEAAETARKMAENLTGDLDEFFSAFNDVKIEVFEGQNTALRDLAKSATETMRAFGEWAKENPELLATLIKIVAITAGLIAVGGALMLTLGSILGPIAMIKYAMVVLGIKSLGVAAAFKSVGGALMVIGKAILANPIVALIVAIAVAAYLIYKHWEPIKQFFIDLWDSVSSLFAGIPDKFRAFGSMIIDGLVGGIKEKFGALKDTVVGMGASVGGWFKDKLGIRSPSRVFMQFGGDTAEGLALGIAANKNSPLKQVAGMAKQVAAAGALSLASGMSFASDIQFDSRAPISAASAQGGQQSASPITINVYGAPGMDETMLAQLVQRELEKAQRQQQMRTRSRFGDLD